jgi:hypothetical protein
MTPEDIRRATAQGVIDAFGTICKLVCAIGVIAVTLIHPDTLPMVLVFAGVGGAVYFAFGSKNSHKELFAWLTWALIVVPPSMVIGLLVGLQFVPALMVLGALGSSACDCRRH